MSSRREFVMGVSAAPLLGAQGDLNRGSLERVKAYVPGE